MTIYALDGVIRRYDWGSPSAIPQLLGIEADGRPAAELWFGAHPDGPSSVPTQGATLDALIGADPVASLGAAVDQRYGSRLPFLLKVLAVDTALSMQVHPTLEQARAGFAAEDAAGVACDAASRNYRDANHKPELLCAITPFEGLCGFRPVGDTLDVVDALALPELGFLADLLRGPDPLRAAFTAVLTHDSQRELAEAVARRAGEFGDAALAGVQLAAHDFPGDIGVVLALLLNPVRLAPGEAIYLGAGNVHAYLRGVAVEIMASSDNVLRCALTPKHVDVPELLKITDFSPLDDPRLPCLGGVFDVPVSDFRLTRLELDAGEPMALDDPGPCIVLCASDSMIVSDVALGPGRAAFVSAGTATTLRGAGLAFVAGVG